MIEEIFHNKIYYVYEEEQLTEHLYVENFSMNHNDKSTVNYMNDSFELSIPQYDNCSEKRYLRTANGKLKAIRETVDTHDHLTENFPLVREDDGIFMEVLDTHEMNLKQKSKIM